MSNQMDTATMLEGMREAMGGPLATDRSIEAEHDRQIMGLRAHAPLRKPVAQDDVDGLGLFDAHRSPTML